MDVNVVSPVSFRLFSFFLLVHSWGNNGEVSVADSQSDARGERENGARVWEGGGVGGGV